MKEHAVTFGLLLDVESECWLFRRQVVTHRVREQAAHAFHGVGVSGDGCAAGIEQCGGGFARAGSVESGANASSGPECDQGALDQALGIDDEIVAFAAKGSPECADFAYAPLAGLSPSAQGRRNHAADAAMQRWHCRKALLRHPVEGRSAARGVFHRR